uniref:At1g61320/AtMIF1 LRR domain-containing protein n=1 Tax=Arundo donax TaxID=35708 RepID=A0A0A9R2N4_ARUDO
MYRANLVSYIRTKLMSIVPNVETLTIHLRREIVNTPIVPGKFLHLKYLHVCFFGLAFSPTYAYFSLVSFLDASPSLETFALSVSHCSSCTYMCMVFMVQQFIKVS